jgi:DNA processing protein
MACPGCQRRAALIAALAPAIENVALDRQGLLGLLGLPEEQLLLAAKVENPRGLLRRLELPLLSKRVPTALCRHDADYPQALAQLDCAPAALYATCAIERLRELLTAPTVTLVGSRRYTPYAHQISSALARDLACAGITVISGMNMGLEGVLHQNAAGAGGHTIAVMPGGPDVPFPDYQSQRKLHREILVRGAAVSELPSGFRPQGFSFVASQRIIAALAGLIVIVEAGGRSCTMFTAQIATDLGADVAVVPGRLTDTGGKWMYGLLRDGAQPIACAQDVTNLIYGTGAREKAA